MLLEKIMQNPINWIDWKLLWLTENFVNAFCRLTGLDQFWLAGKLALSYLGLPPLYQRVREMVSDIETYRYTAAVNGTKDLKTETWLYAHRRLSFLGPVAMCAIYSVYVMGSRTFI